MISSAYSYSCQLENWERYIVLRVTKPVFYAGWRIRLGKLGLGNQRFNISNTGIVQVEKNGENSE